jgi:hypothetical protein
VNSGRSLRPLTWGTDWVPGELRHTFVSIMSAGGVLVEEIARVAGHKHTNTTELVYRCELRPVITTGAELMDEFFSRQPGKVMQSRNSPDRLGTRVSGPARQAKRSPGRS